MKKLTQIFLLLFILSGSAFAQEQGTDGNVPPAPPSQEVIQSFDTDGDGRLNRSERRAMRESFRTQGQFNGNQANGNNTGQSAQFTGQGQRQGGCRRGGGGGQNMSGGR